MKVGFITQLLWPRYGEFWRNLAEMAEYEAVLPTAEGTLNQLGRSELPTVGSVAFRLATAQALALAEEADLLVVPELTLGEHHPRGAGEDPWIAAFGDQLAIAFPELPPLVSAPASLGAPAEPAVLKFLQDGLFDNTLVKRVWDRVRAPLYAERVVRGDPFQKTANAPLFTGVLAQPWLLNEALVAAAKERYGPVVSPLSLSPHMLRDEGARAAERPLLPTDLEVLGAGRLFARRQAVGNIVFIADPQSSADAWLAARLEKLAGPRFTVAELPQMFAPEHAFNVLYNAPEA